LTAIRNAGNEDLFKYVLSMLSRRIPQILGDDAELVLGDTEKFRANLLSCRHLDQVKNVLYTAADKIGERIPSLAERKKKELIQKIKKNIEQHLSDRSLCTALIASDAGLSTGYVRNLFKNSEGISILEYIGSQRLELAKRYLSETDMPVWGICTKTGFINYSYFFTYFRKMTSLTPVEFRQKARSSP
jgi:YesN/AraC family two-component response regulator